MHKGQHHRSQKHRSYLKILEFHLQQPMLCKIFINEVYRIGGYHGWHARLQCGRFVGSRSDRVKPDNRIDMCCFSAKHAALWEKNKYLLARNQDNVSEWDDMAIRELLIQWASTIKIQLSVLVQYKPDLIIIY